MLHTRNHLADKNSGIWISRCHLIRATNLEDDTTPWSSCSKLDVLDRKRVGLKCLQGLYSIKEDFSSLAEDLILFIPKVYLSVVN